MRPQIANRYAFTLIELLVVIAVIGILAAILFPALARRRSQISVCTSNLHQMGQAILMYTADFDGGLPFAPDPLSKHAIGDSSDNDDPVIQLTAHIPYDVRTPLRAYGCIAQLFKCPLDRNKSKFIAAGEFAVYFDECGSSYWYDDKHALTGYKIGDYPTPSTNVIMSDLDFFHLGEGVGIDASTKGTTNLLFVDFHVKSQSWSDRTNYLEANK